jgi:dTDP-4-amino-4,6-dideoxygalactose transaminase
VIAGEGGALVINDPRLVERAEILWEKGTDRTRFSQGLVDKYTWLDVGSSFLPGELTAAFLWAQLEQADAITAERLALWQHYYERCGPLRELGAACPHVPANRVHNGHLFYVLLPDGVSRATVLEDLNSRGVNAVFHYVPLHSSPAGRRFGRVAGSMDVTDDCSGRLIRLPLWVGMGRAAVEQVVDALVASVSSAARESAGKPLSGYAARTFGQA